MEGDKRSDMGKGGGPKTLNRKGGGAPVLSVSHLGPGPRPRSSTFVTR